MPLSPHRPGRSRTSRRSSRCRCRSRTGGAAAPKASATAIEESLPDAIGAFIALAVRPGAAGRSAERGADGLPMRGAARGQARRAILFRRFVSFGEDVTRPYVDAHRGARHPAPAGRRQVVSRPRGGRRRFARRSPPSSGRTTSCRCSPRCSGSAVRDRRRAPVRVPGTLRHVPPVPHSAGARRQLSGRSSALTAEPTAHLMPIAEALRLLAAAAPAAQLPSGRRHDRPIAARTTRAHVGFILRPAGEQALANVLHIAELARQYEAGGGISFRGFIDELQRRPRRPTPPRRRSSKEGSDGVRLMTVHKAKGSSFPVVILADLTCRMQPQRRQPLSRSRREVSAPSG